MNERRRSARGARNSPPPSSCSRPKRDDRSVFFLEIPQGGKKREGRDNLGNAMKPKPA